MITSLHTALPCHISDYFFRVDSRGTKAHCIAKWKIFLEVVFSCFVLGLGAAL